MGDTQLFDGMTAFARWNYLRSAVSREIKSSGITLQKGQYTVLVKEIYHSTKEIPINEVIGGLGRRLSTEAKPQHPFANDPIRYFDIDHRLQQEKLITPPNIWFDTSEIDGKGYWSQDYGYYSTFRAIVTACNRMGIWDTSDQRMPHFTATQAAWNRDTKRWEAVWMITDSQGRSLDGFQWSPQAEELTTDYELPKIKPEKKPEEPPPPEPEAEPTPPKKYSPEVDKAKAKSITDKNLRKNLLQLNKDIDRLKADLKSYKEIGSERAFREAEDELIEAIKTRKKIRTALGDFD